MKYIKISFNQLMCILCAVFLFVSWRMADATAILISAVQVKHRDEIRELKAEMQSLRITVNGVNANCYVDNLGQDDKLETMGWDIDVIYTTLQNEGILDGC